MEIYAASGAAVIQFRNRSIIHLNPRSALLEKGNAVQQVNGIDWTYTATQANNPLTGSKIKAIATDVPGNQGALEITL